MQDGGETAGCRVQVRGWEGMRETVEEGVERGAGWRRDCRLQSTGKGVEGKERW